MIVCDDCPYRGRCENMDRCLHGKNPVPPAQPAPAPQNVNTTKGNALTGTFKSGKAKKPAAKKSATKKATVQ